MGRSIRPFEIALIGIFAIIGLIGLFFLANHQPDSEEARLYGDSVEIWGTFDRRIVEELLEELAKTNKAIEVVTYTQVDSRAFGEELVNAIAEGESPDLVILPHELLVAYRTKLQAISSETIDPRTFRDTYVDGAEIFLRSDGVYGIPFAVDPLVMYWNRDIFSGSGLALPPKTWETLVSQTVQATVRTDDRYNLTQSAVAFGEYVNIEHAKEVLAMLLMQAGSNIVEEGGGGYRVTLGDSLQNALSPAEAVLSFYTQFVVPGKELYSWNRSKRLDRSEFLSGNLALYFGKGSEREALLRENSNLNFDAVTVPQGDGATVKRNYGDFYAFSIPRASDNVVGAYAVANVLADSVNSKTLADALGFAPVHRALYGSAPLDPHQQVVYQSALIARGWLDPAPRETGEVLKSAVEGLTSGRTRMENVIRDTVQGLEALFK